MPPLSAARIAYDAAHREQRNAYNRAWRARNPEYHPAKWAALMERKPECVTARAVINGLIAKGQLVRPASCENCGSPKGTIEAAHYTYSEPLRVRWLCHSCHVKWDQSEPKQ